MRVLIFGDSITYGIWDTGGGWVQRLRSHYDKVQIADSPFKYDQPSIFNLGVGGDHSDDVLKRFEPEVQNRVWPDEPFAFVFAVGINDAYSKNGKNYATPDEYIKNLELIIEKARKFSDKIVFVGISPVDETQRAGGNEVGYKNSRILIFENALIDFCTRQELIHIPIFETFKAKLDKGEHLMDDGLHPNDAGHQLMFEQILPPLNVLLSLK